MLPAVISPAMALSYRMSLTLTVCVVTPCMYTSLRWCIGLEAP